MQSYSFNRQAAVRASDGLIGSGKVQGTLLVVRQQKVRFGLKLLAQDNQFHLFIGAI
jgi:hypothetical protein